MSQTHLFRRIAYLALATVALFAPAPAGLHAEPSSGPGRVTEIQIDKSDHTLSLFADETLIKTYGVALGWGGPGPKQFEGDAKTPVGTYRVTGRIPGLFHQFLVVSYPNDEDRARYAALKKSGEVPAGRGVGHGIGIHGVGDPKLAGVHKETDWTLGCVALDDQEIDEIAKLVRDGTRIVITD